MHGIGPIPIKITFNARLRPAITAGYEDYLTVGGLMAGRKNITGLVPVKAWHVRNEGWAQPITPDSRLAPSLRRRHGKCRKLFAPPRGSHDVRHAILSDDALLASMDKE